MEGNWRVIPYQNTLKLSRKEVKAGIKVTNWAAREIHYKEGNKIKRIVILLLVGLFFGGLIFVDSAHQTAQAQQAQ